MGRYLDEMPDEAEPQPGSVKGRAGTCHHCEEAIVLVGEDADAEWVHEDSGEVECS